jgi:hypothetical protein
MSEDIKGPVDLLHDAGISQMREAGGGALITQIGYFAFNLCLRYVSERAAWPALIIAQRAYWQSYRELTGNMQVLWLSSREPDLMPAIPDCHLIIISESVLEHWVEWLASIKPQILIAYPGELFRRAAMSKRAEAFFKLSRECGEVWTVLHNPTPEDIADSKSVVNLRGIARELGKDTHDSQQISD